MVLIASLSSLWKKASTDGFATGIASIHSIRESASNLGWNLVRARSSDEDVKLLRPTQKKQAHPSSLSAICGTEDQPLHTDGAHLPVPPDVVILVGEHPSDTPTLLWDSRKAIRLDIEARVAVRHGVFVVRNGRDSFHTVARWGIDQIRFDPGCMTPCDGRARHLAAFIAGKRHESELHQWTTARQVLVINNRVMLHARSDATDDSGRELKRLMYQTNERP